MALSLCGPRQSRRVAEAGGRAAVLSAGGLAEGRP